MHKRGVRVELQDLLEDCDRLQEKALLMVKQKNEVEAKNKEVEEARRSLEEKAEQLTLTSKYKSEFLANMSHELRTPLVDAWLLRDLQPVLSAMHRFPSKRHR